MEALPCNKIVYRALRKRWVDQASNVLPAAFIRREPPADEHGLSVDPSSAQSCATALQNCHVASLHVGRIRNLGLDCIPDVPGHANITGVPRPSEDLVRAERLAGQLARLARFIPPEQYQQDAS
jgi:hypothetical protein